MRIIASACLALLAIGCGPGGASQDAPVLNFDPPQAAFTTGIGSGRQITLTLRNVGTSATQFEVVLPAEETWLAGYALFIDIDPDLLQGSLAPGASHQVPLYAECPVVEGIYQQTVEVHYGTRSTQFAVSATCTPAPLEAVVADRTRIASAQDLQDLESYDETTGVFTFGGGNSFALGLGPDDVIVGPATTLAPYGFLRTVERLVSEGGKIYVHTSEAGIADALTQGELSVEAPIDFPGTASIYRADGSISDLNASLSKLLQLGFDVSLIDVDGDPKTLNDQLRLAGSFSLTPTTQFTFKFKVIQKTKRVFGVKIKVPVGISAYLKAGVGIQQDMSLRLLTGDFLTFSGDSGPLIIARATASPIPIPIGPIPLYLVPTFQIDLTSTFSLSAVLDAQASEQLAFSTGLLFDGSLRPFFEHSFRENHHLGALTGIADGRVSLGAGVTLAIAGTVGPYVQVSIGPQFHAVATARELNWTLGGCVTASGGVRSAVDLGTRKILGFKIPLSIPTLGGKFYENCVTWDAGTTVANHPPVADLQIADGNPSRLPNEPFLMVASASDPDGDPLTYSWDPSPLSLTARGPGATYSFRSVGVHSIAFSAVDSYGGRATATRTINIANVPPAATITRIVSGLEGTNPFSFTGSATDANEGPGPEDGAISCDALVWSTDPPGADFSPFGCTTEIFFPRAGEYKVTLTATDPQGLTGSSMVTVTVQP